MSPGSILAVGVGGFFGAIARYVLVAMVDRSAVLSVLPAGTLAVNLIGCLAVGYLYGSVEMRGFFMPGTQLLLGVGFLGGFTTFSTFALETVTLSQRSGWLMGSANIGLQVVLGLALARAGVLLAHR